MPVTVYTCGKCFAQLSENDIADGLNRCPHCFAPLGNALKVRESILRGRMVDIIGGIVCIIVGAALLGADKASASYGLGVCLLICGPMLLLFRVLPLFPLVCKILMWAAGVSVAISIVLLVFNGYGAVAVGCTFFFAIICVGIWLDRRSRRR